MSAYGRNRSVGALVLFTLIKKPEWFRKSIKRRVEKHYKYFAWVRRQTERSKALSDDDIRVIIEKAVMFKTYVTLALFFLLVVFVYEIYALYEEPILGPDPPYWRQLLLGVVGGGVFAAIMAFVGHISLRMRIRQLIN